MCPPSPRACNPGLSGELLRSCATTRTQVSCRVGRAGAVPEPEADEYRHHRGKDKGRDRFQSMTLPISENA